MYSLLRDGVREFGDFQTPDAYAADVMRWIARRSGQPTAVFEPTCGSGAFIRAARTVFGKRPRVLGLEIKQQYRPHLDALIDPNTVVCFGDACELDLVQLLRRAEIQGGLIVGNLPWVTTDGLTRMRVQRTPKRTNPKGLRGLDAKTGSSSFDIAEYIAIRLIDVISFAWHGDGAMGLLMKESVARRLLLEVRRRGMGVADAVVVAIDAAAVFGVAVDACLLYVRFDHAAVPLRTASVAQSLDHDATTLWYVTDSIVSTSEALGGATSALDWRQGMKHDAAAVFELSRSAEGYVNGHEERVLVEDDVIFPFVRARDLARGHGHDGTSFVLMPYRGLRGSEQTLRQSAPLLYDYLSAHASVLDARRSSIYKGGPRFATFGVGPYSFAMHKIAISGLHRTPRFVVLSGDRPIQVSDTAYTVSFENALDARLVAGLLSSRRCVETLATGIFSGKRPITKRLLMQLDLCLLASDPEVAEHVIHSLPSGDRTTIPHETLMHRLRALVKRIEQPELIVFPA